MSVASDWRDQAACRGVNVNLFFPISEHDPVVPITISRFCTPCPVACSCLEYALSVGAEDGIWGGTTGDERTVIAKQRRKGAT